MRDSQKVYIKGDPNRGAEVIKALTDLGGVNSWSYAGTDEKSLYYINPRGNIEYIYDYEFLPECLLVKEFYKEIKLPRWKPKYKERYYCINWRGAVVDDIWHDTQDEEICYEFGNCFKTYDEAKAASYKVQEILNK